MILCHNCFCDKELTYIIKSLRQKGNCPTCKKNDVYIYNTSENNELVAYFEELIGIYTPARLLPVNFPKAETRLIKNELLINWHIFNNLKETLVYNIITSICSEKYQKSPELFDMPVGIAELYNETYLTEKSLLKNNDWDGFVNSLKTQNRFHTSFINLEILKRFCSYINRQYKKGDIFFRGRISTSEGFSIYDMDAPCHKNATDGRANARGVRCLYLADNLETVIHEVKAGAFDFITIGSFELQEDILVADLNYIDKISPFREEMDYMDHAINKQHLIKINDEMGKALRKSDSTLDYVPTQYISDFIKSIEDKGKKVYAGLKYNSTMHEEGFNLAIFNPDLFKCIKVEHYKILNIQYNKRIV